MLKKILAVVMVLVAVLLVVIALQPSEFRLTRSATMAAPPSAPFAEVNDFHNWDHWSPWAKLDPAMQVSFEGAPSGEGAIYSWNGNGQVGEGRMTITESKPDEVVRIKLEFVKPFQATNDAEFTFENQGEKTLVTWAMTGTNGFFSKAFNLFFNMDAIIGQDFEKGLANMKSAVETTNDP